MYKKKEILGHINELKINFNALTLINKRMVKEKKEEAGLGFSERDLKSKKLEILELIRSEGEMASVASVMQRQNRYPSSFSFDISETDVYRVLLEPFIKRETGVLKLSDGEDYAELGFRPGELIYAVYKDRSGERAFFELLDFKGGKAEFFPRDFIEKPRTITSETSKLIKRTLEQMVIPTIHNET